jgi:hypothetical protein
MEEIVDTNSTPALGAAPKAPSAASREVRLTKGLVGGALLLGAGLQSWVPPGGFTLVAGALLAGAIVVVAADVAPGRVRETIAGFRFTATLLLVLATMAVLGTLILQMKPSALYLSRYGVAGKAILALRLDDVFHGLPFALVIALFSASVICSALARLPFRLRSAGFFVCHLGLLTSLAGAAASATLAVRGRLDLYAGGETATEVGLTKAGAPTGGVRPLGFTLRLDRFQLVNYEPEYRVGYYEQVETTDEHGRHASWLLKASFDPDTARHRLPNGDSFRLKRIYPDFRHSPNPTPGTFEYGTASQEWKNPGADMEVLQQGVPREELMLAHHPKGFFLSPTRALVFEKREKEVKAYISDLTVTQGGTEVTRAISVNEPFTFNGWTFYQANYNPEVPTYSGIEAVYDPGVSWVFTGFALICLGVVWMMYVEPRLRRKTAQSVVHA